MIETKTDYDTYEESIALPVAIEPGIISTLARAEIDTAIATAKQYPRHIGKAKSEILSLVTMTEATAEKCMYALPRGGKPIKGPSVRLAEIVYQMWGNNWVDSRVIAIDKVNKVVIARGTYRDLEKNTTISKDVQRRIADKNGRLFSDDMITVTGNAACAIAMRNAILAGIPEGVWGEAYEAAEEVVAGTTATLAERREKAFKAFAAFGVKPEQIFGELGVKGVDEIGLQHMPTLVAMHSALKNGEATVEEMFDPRKTGSTHEVVTNPLKDEPVEKAPIPIDYKVIGVTAHKQGVPRDRPPGELRSADRADDLKEWLSGWDSH